MSTVCARRGLFSAEAILAARTENRKMKKETNGERNGQDARSPRGVINRPETSRTRVVCHTGVNMPSLGIPSAGAGAREAALAAWRVRQFGGDFDPVRAVVEDAVATFSRRQPTIDRALWLKVANIIGWETFREIYFEQRSVMVDSARRGHPLRNPAAAFHKKLQALRPASVEATGVSLPRGADNRGSGALAASSRTEGGAA